MATKVTALTANTTPDDGDLLYIVDDPAGTPFSQKITLANLRTKILEDQPQVVGSSSPSGVSEVDLTIPTGFAEFELTGWLLPATDDVQLLLRCDDGGGFDDTNEYDVHWWAMAGGTQADGGGTSHGVWLSRSSFQVAGSGANDGIQFRARISRAKDAAWTYFDVLSTMIDTGGATAQWRSTNTHRVAASLDALRLLFASGNIADGEVRLIGIP